MERRLPSSNQRKFLLGVQNGSRRAAVYRIAFSVVLLTFALPLSLIFVANAFGIAIPLVPAVLYLAWVLLVDAWSLVRGVSRDSVPAFPTRSGYILWFTVAFVTCFTWIAFVLIRADWIR